MEKNSHKHGLHRKLWNTNYSVKDKIEKNLKNISEQMKMKTQRTKTYGMQQQQYKDKLILTNAYSKKEERSQ